MKKLLSALLLAACIHAGAQEKTDEKSAFAASFPYVAISDWKPGMKFMTEPITLMNMSSELDLVKYKSKNLTARRLDQGDFQGKTFTFTGFEKRKEKCANEECDKTYLVFECEGQQYEYSSFFTLNTMKDFKEASVTSIVYIDEIEKATEALKGKTLFVMSADWWMDDQAKPLRKGRYLPVTVTDIAVGNQDGPVKVIFKTEEDDKPYFINTRLSGINKATGQFGMEFDDAFSFDDPKEKFPDISAEVWHHIQHATLQNGMTKREANLSWGKPDKVSSSKMNEVEMETWYYGTSKKVIFKNGAVDSFIN